ncbi:MAG: AarF/ABC1/UbiB kinase family protein [Bacteroidetes bacterium]|nr:MAG: AarF/ABC1/UbiB kinase family protein [Bacteroidota bacterium]
MSDEKPKNQNSIPTSKVERASKFIKTGVKIGGNYIKHYAKKMVDPSMNRNQLDKDNAEDIYETLSQLKGSALKVAQMMSMDKNMIPKAYSDKFSMAQYSAPPLSYPLVVKTFQQFFGKNPTEIFDEFNKDARNAASIGQVHEAKKDGKKLAVKIQYPGVADSITSDLKMVKPFATQLLGLNERDLAMYMSEVEKMLIDETDYTLELKRSLEISQACAHLPHTFFATYYPKLSSKRILTMDWLEGEHLDVFVKTNPSQEVRNQIGQALWDFYDYQMHVLKAVHADPHPGNFLMRNDGTLAIIDFGCVKVIPEDYYHHHFQVLNPKVLDDRPKLIDLFYKLEFINAEDNADEQKIFIDLFSQMIRLTVKPFLTSEFDFGNDDYFQNLYNFAEEASKIEEIRKSKRPRGSKDSLYLNRTYFGLYSMLNQLQAKVQTTTVWKMNE